MGIGVMLLALTLMLMMVVFDLQVSLIEPVGRVKEEAQNKFY